METYMLIEIIGYIGSALVLVSFLMSSVVKLRVINMIGGLVFGTYALLIHSYPTALMQLCLILINLYYLMRLKKNTRHFDLIDGKKDDAFLNYMLDYYNNDIRTYFPELGRAASAADAAYIVCCDAVPAGIFLGKKRDGKTVEIICDYSTPTYRDCSVGKYLYSQLPGLGVKRLVFAGDAGKHEPYLQKMGFVKKDNEYVKSM